MGQFGIPKKPGRLFPTILTNQQGHSVLGVHTASWEALSMIFSFEWLSSEDNSGFALNLKSGFYRNQRGGYIQNDVDLLAKNNLRINALPQLYCNLEVIT